MRNLHRIFAHILLTAPVACGGIAIVEGTQTDSGTKADATADGASPDAGADASPTCTVTPYIARQPDCSTSLEWQAVYVHPCGYPNGIKLSDGVTDEECAAVCKELWGTGPGGAKCSEYKLDDLPGPAVNCPVCIPASVGRRPAGYQVDALIGYSPIAKWLGEVASLERASIDAFRILRRELRHYGAPVELITEAHGAEADEVRHARVMSIFAYRESAHIDQRKIVESPTRSLEAIAMENAIEGCVREAYGALMAGWQARHAKREDFRRAMERVAFDETEHASFAYRVHDWLMSKLDAASQERVIAAMDKELEDLRTRVTSEPEAELVEELGVPSSVVATHLADRLVLALRGNVEIAA